MPERQQLADRPHPLPLSHPLGEGGVGLSALGRGSELSAESFITKEVVAQRLCVTPETVRRWASDGRLPSHHFGRRLRFKWSEVELALVAGGVNQKCKIKNAKLKMRGGRPGDDAN